MPQALTTHRAALVKHTQCFLLGKTRPSAEFLTSYTYRSHWPDVRRYFADWADCELEAVDWNDDRETVTIDGVDVGTITVQIRDAAQVGSE